MSLSVTEVRVQISSEVFACPNNAKDNACVIFVIEMDRFEFSVDYVFKQKRCIWVWGCIADADRLDTDKDQTVAGGEAGLE